MNNGNNGSPGAAKAFGRLLRFYRERAKVSQELLGKETGYSKSQVAMIERGERRAKGRFVEIADGMLSAQGALLEVAEEVTASGVAAWFEDYLVEELKAAGIHKYENHLIPGLLQNEDYAHAAFVSERPPLDEEEIEAGVAARLARQPLLFRRPAPLVTFVLEKAALTKPLGGKGVLRKNLLHILEVGQLPNVEIQVMPEDRETHAGLSGPFTLLETEERRSQLVYVEGQGGRYFLSEQPDVGDAFARYSTLRAQALTPEDSVRLIEQVEREL
ncbi:helix-turn-helix domain-containing protein [Streptomyces vilmorinianum]|uniref:helix-turn-helix domain-containing protein n=1 Tax=Streptomyces vilmorinianum TaxID=3051092 RepID=UPI0020C790B1|nr:helix-turn-helix transcriptional regulator [Streptomyces vilmorinianum]